MKITLTVIAGLVPAIHVCRCQDVDARHKAGHDENLTLTSKEN